MPFLMRIATFLTLALILGSCGRRETSELKTGTWRGVIDIQGQELPFGLEIMSNGDQYTANLVNAGERILLDEITITGDTVNMVLHVFDASLRAKILGDRLEGTFVKNYAPQANMPFHAT